MRTYNSDLGGSSLLGNQWMSSNADLQLSQVDASKIELIYSAASKVPLTGSDAAGYASQAPLRLTLEHDATAETYTLTNASTGAVVIFHDFTVSAQGNRGRIKEVTSESWKADGKNGLTYSYNYQGQVTQITTSNGQACSINFTYANNRITRIEVVDPSTTPDTVFEAVEYLYTASSHHADVGASGDLVQVKRMWKASGDAEATLSNEAYTQYRYDGGNLQGVFNDQTLKRMVDDYPSISTCEELLEESNSYNDGSTISIEDYADKWVTYSASDDATNSVSMSHWSAGTKNLVTDLGFQDRDNTGFVKSQRIGSSGCSSCGGASTSTKNYYYLENSTASDDNEVKYLVVEDTLDSSGDGLYRTIHGLNPKGVELRTAFITEPYGTAPDRQYTCTSVKLIETSEHTASGKSQKRGLIKEARAADAQDVSDDADLKKFLDPYDGSSWANDTATLLADADGTGAIYVNYFNDEGRSLSSWVKRGHDGAEYYLSATEWTSGDPHLESKRYSFPTKTNVLGDGKVWSLAYTFWTGTDNLKSVTATSPTVSTSQNGSGQPATTKIWYDEAGRQRWSQDEEGYLTYTSYCKDTGLPAYEAVDVDPSSMPSGASSTHLVQVTDDGANTLPPTRDSSLPAAIAQETTTYYDMLGRPTLVIDATGARHATVYEEERTISMPELNGSGVPQGVITYTEENSLGQMSESIAVRADYTAVSTEGTSPNKTPTGFSTEPDQSDYVSWTRYAYNEHGQTKWVDTYHDIPTAGSGTLGDNYSRVATLYDSEGVAQATVTYVEGSETSATVQISYTKLDSMRRPFALQSWRETGFNFSTMTLSAVETSAMSEPYKSETKYDSNGEVAGTLQYHNATGVTQGDYTYTKTYFDFRRRVVGSERYYNNEGTGTPLGPFTVSDLDWMGRVTATAVFDAQPTWSTITGGYGDTDYAEDTTTDRRALSRTMYDDLGQVYRTERVTINGSTGAVVGAIRTDNFYDARGNLVATRDPHGVGMEYAYDGLGRQYQSRSVVELEATNYSSGVYQYRAPEPDPSLANMTGGDDKVLTLSHTVYDDDGMPVEQHDFDANHNDPDGLDLDGSDCVRTTSFSWYDDRGRLTTSADYGSGDGSSSADEWDFNTAPTYNATSEPGWSDSAVRNGYLLVTKFGYDDRTGRQSVTTSGVRNGTSEVETTSTKTFYDDLGRQTHTVENWQGTYDPTAGGTPSSAADEDREVRWEYNGLGQTTKLIAVNGSTDQETLYLYEDPHNASLVTSTIYPDSSDTTSTGTDQVKTAYHLDGSVDTITDQRGVVRTFTYDDHRRVTLDAVTTLPGSVDGAVRAIGRAYDDLGRVTTITSYDTATSPGASDIVNQVKHTYDDTIGRITKTEQEHDGAVTTGTPAVRYVYDESLNSGLYNDGLRRTDVFYPTFSSSTKHEVYYGSGNSITDRLSRPVYNKLFDGTLRTGTYAHTIKPLYTGGGRMTRLFSNSDSTGFFTQLNYYDGVGVYDGWDRFGRVVRQEWSQYSGGWNTVDKHTYTYDLAGNRLTRDVDSGTTHDQTFTYDGLQRLQSVDSGTAGEDRYWGLDALGNWDELYHNATGIGTADESRTHNAANEVTQVSGGPVSGQPLHDAAGNLTLVGGQNGDQYTYDAWNRLVRVFYENQAEVEVDKGLYEYDGLNRRVERTEDSTTTRFYYNDQWQVLTETDGSDTAVAIYLYNDDYVDSVAVRMTSTSHSNGEGEHLYLHDALYNVTALMERRTGNPVVERYTYSPYGEATVLDASYNTLTTQESTVDNELLYTGRRVDPETGLQINRHRYYLPGLGRWLNRDPIGYDGGSRNLYEYAGSRPTYAADPTGLKCCSGKGCKWGGYMNVRMVGGVFGIGNIFFSASAKDTTGCAYAVRAAGRGVAAIQGAGYFNMTSRFNGKSAPCKWPVNKGSSFSAGNASLILPGGVPSIFRGSVGSITWTDTWVGGGYGISILAALKGKVQAVGRAGPPPNPPSCDCKNK